MRTLYKTIILMALFFSVTSANEKISLQLDWLHQFQFAGYYMAKEKGYYADKKLDVSIQEFNFNVNLLQNVLNNEGAYAVGKSSLIIDKISGSNIVALAAIYQHSPMVLLTKKDSNIKYPQDLYKKSVMLTADARTAIAITSMIASKGLKNEDVNFIPHSFKLDDLINGKTDAMGSYLSNEPYLLKQRGIEFNILDPRDYGFDFYGGILFTSQKELKQHPQRVRNFYEATLKGWRYAFSHIQETAQIIVDKYNTQNKSLASLIYEGNILKELSEFEQGSLGDISSKKYREIIKIYSLLGYEHQYDALNEFIYNPNSIILNDEEKEYLKNHTIYYKNSQTRPFDNGNNKGIEFEYIHLLKDFLPINIEFSEKKSDFELSIKSPKGVVSKAIKQYPFAIVTRDDINYIQALEHLNTKKVAIVKDSFYDTLYKNRYSKINYHISNTLEEALQLLSEKKVFAVIHSMPIVVETISQNSYKKIKISGITSIVHDMNFIIHNNNKLLSSVLNKAIDQMMKSDLIQIDKTFLAPKIKKESNNNRWLYKILIPVVFLILVILFFNKKLSNETKKRKALEESVKEISNIDTLTHINNRKMSIQHLDNAIALAHRYDRPLCLIFFDVDNFKDINNTYSYAIGDNILQELASLISSNIRTSDIVGRWDGEKFILILPETSKEQARISAENLKKLIYNYDFNVIKRYITCSFGVAEYVKGEESYALVKRVLEALDGAKEDGKNRVKAV